MYIYALSAFAATVDPHLRRCSSHRKSRAGPQQTFTLQPTQGPSNAHRRQSRLVFRTVFKGKPHNGQLHLPPASVPFTRFGFMKLWRIILTRQDPRARFRTSTWSRSSACRIRTAARESFLLQLDAASRVLLEKVRKLLVD